MTSHYSCDVARREVLRLGLYAGGLDDGNMRYTTDFRRVYATLIREWMNHSDVSAVLGRDFEPLGVFG